MEDDTTEEENNLFSYDYLTDVLKYDEQGFCDHAHINEQYEKQQYKPTRAAKNDGFYTITRKKNPEIEMSDGKFYESKLKFHISLPEDDSKIDPSRSSEERTFYKRGWDIIQNTLRAENVGYFKIAGEVIRMSKETDPPHQEGKDVTIYARENPEYDETDWIRIIRKVTTNLVEAGIPPGYKTSREGDRADSELKGNNYVSYRYEGKAPKSDIFAKSSTIKTFDWPDNQIPNIQTEAANMNQNNPDKSCCNIS